MVYFLAANNIGSVPAPDIPIYSLGGKSIAFDPIGKLIAEASYDQEEILMIELDRDHLEYARKLHMMFRDRRPETYGIISTNTDEIQRN
jgi:N-carbamoylputrescine amidase